MNYERDFNAETQDVVERKYAYDFDFDIMHHYMIRTFEKFFRLGNLLELGSFQGDFTKKLKQYFNDITCVEASDMAIQQAKINLNDDGINYICSSFETVNLPRRYENVIMTHVLEHVDDPVKVLRRINDEWLADNGYFFLVCPNANAASRQIAVKMGLISSNAAVTPAEAVHGHRCTYSFDTLERDVRSAGLEVVDAAGIFFKALANFQWDKLLKTDIVSPEYIEGCYQLGFKYPDLCASIFLLCKKGSG